jgi:hypothetical protein
MVRPAFAAGAPPPALSRGAFSPRTCSPPPPRRAARAARPTMALRAVEGYNGAFGLDKEVREALVRLLTDAEFSARVAVEGKCESVFFTGDLFQPVPYSAGTPLGMPREMEAFARDVGFMVVNIPPTVMFEARCFKPSRLCAVFKRFAVQPEERARFADALAERESAAARRAEAMATAAFAAPTEGEDAWQGIGTLIKQTLRDGDALDEAEERELDDLVV